MENVAGSELTGSEIGCRPWLVVLLGVNGCVPFRCGGTMFLCFCAALAVAPVCSVFFMFVWVRFCE